MLNDFTDKLSRSGYGEVRIREIRKSGFIGYKRKSKRHIEECGQIHRPGVDKLGRRQLNKVVRKTTGSRRGVEEK